MTITGIERTVADLRALPQAFSDKIIKAAMMDAMEAIQTAARARAPVFMGILQESIVRSVKKEGTDFHGKIGIDAKANVSVGMRIQGRHAGDPIMEKPTKYAHFVEFGTSRAAAHPFLRPALDTQWRNAVARLQANINDAIDKYVDANGPLPAASP